MFRRKSREQRELKAEVEVNEHSYRTIRLSGAEGACDVFLHTKEGRVIAAAFGLPEPWTLPDRAYSSYAVYLEDSSSGNRTRIDMVRIWDRNWAAVKTVGPVVEFIDRVFVSPVAEGAVGHAALFGTYKQE